MHAVCAICANRAPEQPDRLANGLIWPGPAPAGVRRRVPPRSPPANPGSRAPAVPAATVAGEVRRARNAHMACRLGGKTGEDPTSRVARTLDHGFCTRAYFAPMRAKRFQMLAILAVVLTVLAVPALVRAATVGEIQPSPSRICRPASRRQRRSRAIGASCEPGPGCCVIQPGSGQSTNLVTQGTTSSAIQAGASTP